jgi:hypothetical protein
MFQNSYSFSVFTNFSDDVPPLQGVWVMTQYVFMSGLTRAGILQQKVQN